MRKRLLRLALIIELTAGLLLLLSYGARLYQDFVLLGGWEARLYPGLITLIFVVHATRVLLKGTPRRWFFLARYITGASLLFCYLLISSLLGELFEFHHETRREAGHFFIYRESDLLRPSNCHQFIAYRKTSFLPIGFFYSGWYLHACSLKDG
jgi:hypothetical protein